MGNNMNTRGVFYNLLRPEFLKSYSIPLSSDAYSGWGASDKNGVSYNREVKEATIFLLSVQIPKFAEYLETNFQFRNFDYLIAKLHSHGFF